MLLLVLILLATTVTDAAAHSTQTRSVLTFNTRLSEGFTPGTGNSERRAAIIDGIRELDADAVCLQEVWIGNDVEQITESLSDVYPYSFTLLHQTGELPTNSTLHPPACDVDALGYFLQCLLESSCDDPTDELFAACAIHYCLNPFLNLSQKCLTCFFSIGLAHINHVFEICAIPVDLNFNDPGLVLLSKYPICAPTYTDYHPGVTQIFRRGYINAKINRLGAVTCTQQTSLLPYYIEAHLAHDGLFTNYEDQHANETAKLLSFVTATGKPHIVLGDFNTGPAIPKKDIEAAFGDDYHMLSHYLNSRLLHQCTRCSDNAYATPGSASEIIDHVFTQRHDTFKVSRVLDDVVVPSSGLPLSDHYGVFAKIKGIKDDLQCCRQMY